MADAIQPLAQLSFDAATIMKSYPPRLHHRNKQVVFRIACPGGTCGRTRDYTRWWAMPLPSAIEKAAPILTIEGRRC